MSKYISLSRNDLYSFIIILPLVLLYEVLGYINNFESQLSIRNGADVYIRQFFQIFGEYANIIYASGLMLFLLFIFFKNKSLFLLSEINLSFLFLMIIESLIHALSLLILLNLVMPSLDMFSNPVFREIYLSIGAGIWEEFLFRYILISLLIILFNKIFKNISLIDYLMIIVISAYIFSFYHFLGPFGDIPTLYLLIFRVLFQIASSFIPITGSDIQHKIKQQTIEDMDISIIQD